MNEDTKRIALIAGAIALAILSIGAGALIALSGSDGVREGPSSSPTPTSTPSRSPAGTPSASLSPSGSPVIEDGRHFVYVESATRGGDGAIAVTFDLAYFLTGSEGEQAAAEHSDEFVNGYYIVNDNPKLRTLPLADHVRVAYIPVDACCEVQVGNIDAWLEAVQETNQTDYAGTDAPWWITVRGGEIVRIQQQYLP